MSMLFLLPILASAFYVIDFPLIFLVFFSWLLYLRVGNDEVDWVSEQRVGLTGCEPQCRVIKQGIFGKSP